MKTNRLTKDEIDAIIKALAIQLGAEVEGPDLDPDPVYQTAYNKMLLRRAAARRSARLRAKAVVILTAAILLTGIQPVPAQTASITEWHQQPPPFAPKGSAGAGWVHPSTRSLPLEVSSNAPGPDAPGHTQTEINGEVRTVPRWMVIEMLKRELAR